MPLGENNNVGKNGTFLQFTAPAAGRAFLFFQLSTDSVVNLVVTPAGNSSSPAGAINSGNTIKANEPYMMDFPVSEGAAYQFQVATAQSAGVYASLEVQAK